MEQLGAPVLKIGDWNAKRRPTFCSSPFRCLPNEHGGRVDTALQGVVFAAIMTVLIDPHGRKAPVVLHSSTCGRRLQLQAAPADENSPRQLSGVSIQQLSGGRARPPP